MSACFTTGARRGRVSLSTPSKHTRFSGNLLLSVAIGVLLAITFTLYVRSVKLIDRANDQRIESFLLAQELRQSSDDLTRMVRTYVVTGDSVYKQHFQDILDIRNGKKPRPEAYWRVYWDLKTVDGQPPRPDSRQTIALLDLMRQARFTEDEFHKLAEAKASSEALTAVESAAMKLVESPGPEPEARRDKALGMVHDSKYLQAKVGIMKPIDDFVALVDRRTLGAVQIAYDQALALQYLFIGFALGLMFMLWRTYIAMHEILGGSLGDIFAQITKIGSGDFSATIQVKGAQRNSVLGWVGKMQTELRDGERQRKQAEEQLKATTKRLQMLWQSIENCPAAIVITDTRGDIEYVNPKFIEVTGYSREELLGQNPRLLKSGQMPDSIYEDMWRTLSAGQNWRGELCNRRKDGTLIWESTTITPVKNESGEIVNYLGIKQDITEHKRAEEELRLANFLSDQALDLTKAGYWHVPLDGSGWYNSSERAATLFGDLPREEWRYRVMEEWFTNVEAGDKAAAEKTLENFTAAAEGRIPEYNSIYAYKRPVDGRIVWIHALGHVVKDATGKPTDMYGVTQDIT